MTKEKVLKIPTPVCLRRIFTVSFVSRQRPGGSLLRRNPRLWVPCGSLSEIRQKKFRRCRRFGRVSQPSGQRGTTYFWPRLSLFCVQASHSMCGLFGRIGLHHPLNGIVNPGNTKGGSITVPLTSCLTGLESAVWQLTIFVFICKTE